MTDGSATGAQDTEGTTTVADKTALAAEVKESVIAALQPKLNKLAREIKTLRDQVGGTPVAAPTKAAAKKAPGRPAQEGVCLAGQDPEKCKEASLAKYQGKKGQPDTGCRGASCRAANTEYYRGLRERQKAEEQTTASPAKKAAATKAVAKKVAAAPAKAAAKKAPPTKAAATKAPAKKAVAKKAVSKKA